MAARGDERSMLMILLEPVLRISLAQALIASGSQDTHRTLLISKAQLESGE